MGSYINVSDTHYNYVIPENGKEQVTQSFRRRWEMKKIILIFLLSSIIILITKNGYAYADPGIGGTLYQIVILVFGGLGVFFITLKSRLFRIFWKNKNKKVKNQQKKTVNE